MHPGRAHWRFIVWTFAFLVPFGLVALVSVPFVFAAEPSALPVAESPSAPSGEPELPVVTVDASPQPPMDPVAPPPEPPVEAPPIDPLRPGCPSATTMSVWAHYDDDLLFAGARIADALASGQCVRTVFLTGGDAGRGAVYQAGRERGIQRAYDVMRGRGGEWTATTVTLATGAVVTITSPVDEPRISLVFFALPDGNLNGQGFPATHHRSLAQLDAERIRDLSDLRGTYRLDRAGVIASLRILIEGFAPSAIITHVPGTARQWSDGDHSDHAVTGVMMRQAWRDSGLEPGVITYALGYPSSSRTANLSGEALARKIAAFQAYAMDDPVTAACRDTGSCLALRGFGQWLQREYAITENEVAPAG